MVSSPVQDEWLNTTWFEGRFQSTPARECVKPFGSLCMSCQTIATSMLEVDSCLTPDLPSSWLSPILLSGVIVICALLMYFVWHLRHKQLAIETLSCPLSIDLLFCSKRLFRSHNSYHVSRPRMSRSSACFCCPSRTSTSFQTYVVLFLSMITPPTLFLCAAAVDVAIL